MSSAERVWLITGCSTGFGRELVRQLLGRGPAVVATARNPASLEEFASHPSAAVTALDVTSPDQIAAGVALAEAQFGRIDVLVNNAGYGYLAAIEEGEEDDIRAMFETNVFGLVNMTRAVLPGMRARRSGHIVNISSVGGLIGFPGIGLLQCHQVRRRGPLRGAGERGRAARHQGHDRRAGALPNRLGRTLAEDAADADRRLRRDGRCPTRRHPWLQRQSAGRSGARSGGDDRGRGVGKPAAASAAGQAGLRHGQCEAENLRRRTRGLARRDPGRGLSRPELIALRRSTGRKSRSSSAGRTGCAGREPARRPTHPDVRYWTRLPFVSCGLF